LNENKSLANEVGNFKYSIRTTGKLNAELTIDFSNLSIEPCFSDDYTKMMQMDGDVLLRIMQHEILWGDAYASCSIILDRRPPEYYNREFWKWLYNLDALQFEVSIKKTA